MSYNIYHDLEIAASAYEVYEAVSQPVHLVNWWPEKCTGSPKTGEMYNFQFTEAYNWFGKVTKAIAGEDVLIFGTGDQKRSFMHVKDAVRAVTELMLTGKGIGQEYNVGNPIEITMNDLAKKVIERIGSSSKIVHKSYEEVYGPGYEDMNRRTADITKLKTTLGFEMDFSLDDILDDVVAYYKTKMLA